MNIEAATRVTWFCHSAKESMYLPSDTHMLLNTVMDIRTTYPNKVYQSVQLELVVISTSGRPQTSNSCGSK